MTKKSLLMAAFACITALVQGCFHSSHELDVKPVEIKPMHVTIDVNLKVEKQLAEFFDQVDKKAAEISANKKESQKFPLASTSTLQQTPSALPTQTSNKN